MAAKLYNHAEGKWVELPDDQVDSAISTGTHTFETGVDVPVVAPDGALTSVKSDDLYKAFQEGYRWQTQSDRDIDYDVQRANIQKKNFDDAGEAFLGGVARGMTLGASDVAIPAVAGVFGGDAAAVKEGLKTNKETSPYASTAGSLAGALAPAGLAAKGGQAVFGAGEAAADALTAGLGTSRAAKAVQTVAGTALGSAAEGAYWGMGEGVSEAALGRPEDVVNNLVAGVGLGALTGGVFGAAIGAGEAATPYLTKAFQAAADTTKNAVGNAARKLEQNRVVAALNREGEQELASKFSQFAGDPETYDKIKQLWMSGERKAAEEYAANVTELSKAFETEQKELRKGLIGYFKEASKTEQEAMNSALQQAGGDAWAANNQIYKQIQAKSNSFREGVTQFENVADPARVEQHMAAMDTAITNLRKVGTPQAERYADTLESYGFRNFKPGTTTEGQEFVALDNLKRNVIDYVKDVRQAGDTRVSKELNDVWKYTKNVLTDEKSTIPEAIKAFSRDLDADYTAYNALKDMLGKKTLKSSALSRLAADPEKLDAIDPLFKNYQQFTPELQQLKSAAGNVARRNEVLADIRAKISDMKQTNINGQLSLDDLHQIITESGFIKGNPLSRIQRMQEISKYLNQVDNAASPLERVIFMDRQLNGGPSRLEKYLPHEKHMELLDKVLKVGGSKPGFIARNAHEIGAGVGSMFGGGAGWKAGGMAGSAYGALKSFTSKSPKEIMLGIARVEKATNAGVQKLTNASKAAVQALTSSTFRRGAVAYKALNPDPKRFKQVSDNIKKMISPEAQLQALSEMPQSAAPNVHQALATKMSQAVSYLHTHLPEDPTAPYSVFPDKSKWVPSDLDMAKFQRRVEVVNDPTVAIHRISEGTVTPEQVDALKNVYPEIFSTLQQDIISGIMDSKETPSYQSRLILAQVFGIPTSLSSTPQFIQQMQSSFQQQEQGGGRPTGSPDAQPRGKPQKSIDIKPMESIATPGQSIAFKTDVH